MEKKKQLLLQNKNMVLVLVTSPTCWWKKPNLLDAKLTLAMRTPMEANGKASVDICESSWVAHFQKVLESLLQTCVFIVMLYGAMVS